MKENKLNEYMEDVDDFIERNGLSGSPYRIYNLWSKRRSPRLENDESYAILQHIHRNKNIDPFLFSEFRKTENKISA